MAVTGCVLLTILAVAAPAQAAPAIQIRKVYYDSPGPDYGTNKSLNAEYIVIKNTSSKAKSLKGWTIRDPAHHVYTFGSYTLGAGKSVTLHTGKGTNTNTHRYHRGFAGSGATQAVHGPTELMKVCTHARQLAMPNSRVTGYLGS